MSKRSVRCRAGQANLRTNLLEFHSAFPELDDKVGKLLCTRLQKKVDLNPFRRFAVTAIVRAGRVRQLRKRTVDHRLRRDGKSTCKPFMHFARLVMRRDRDLSANQKRSENVISGSNVALEG
ncbi:MAG: hypothetical protein AAGF31_03215 [Planctomycetota bacterium]